MATMLRKRSTKDELAFVEEQLRRFTDPYDTVRFMWQQRLEALQKEIEEQERVSDSYGEVALLFEGLPVRGSEEIRVAFSTKVLDNYQNLVSVLVAEAAGKEVGTRGQVPKSFTSQLFIKDMLRGSVGFLLEEQSPDQQSLLPSALKSAIEDATNVLSDLSSPDSATFQARIDRLSARTIGAVKKIAKTLNDAGAEAKVVGSDNEIRLSHDRISVLHSRLNEVEITENPETVEGVLLGLFPDRRQFEFRIGDDGPVIYGPVSEDLDERYLSSPDFASSILLKPVKARFLVISKLRAGQIQSQERLLEALELKNKVPRV